MSSVVLVTGAATGIGNLTARALATAGHTVYASVRDIDGRNAAHADALVELGRREGLDLRVVELDEQSEASAESAVARILDEMGQLNKNTLLYRVYSQILAVQLAQMRSAISGR